MDKVTPYEYHNDRLGAQARFLFDGENAHERSLKLISARSLQLRIQRKNIIRLRNNAPGCPMLVLWSSLPLAWQNLLIKAFGEPQKQVRRSLFAQHYVRDARFFDEFSRFKFPDGSSLSDDKVDEYTVNASVLATIQTIYDRRRKYRRELRQNVGGAWESVCTEARNFKAEVLHTLPDSTDRLRKELAKFRREGWRGLISRHHGNNNARVVTPDVELFINDLFADCVAKPTKVEVERRYNGFLDGYIEAINNETGERYNPGDFPALSASTITSYLSKWRNAIATEGMRSGDRQKYMAKFTPYASLKQPEYAGSIISVDDRQPAFEYERGKRMWFYNGIDLGSEAFTCWVYGKTKEGIILEFYRQLVRNYAQWGISLPAEIEAEASLNSSFRGTFLEEGNMFQYVRIEPNKARAKRIERYYGNLRYEYEKEREGWLARPFALREANQAGPKESPLVPYDKLVSGCLCDIERWNNTRHSKIENMTRWEVFLAMQHPHIRPTNYRGIIPYLGYSTETSCRTGIIKLDNREFLLGNNGVIAVGKQLIQLMDVAEGRRINVRWLDGNDGEVLKAYVYVGDTFVCEAVRKPEYHRARIERTDECEANLELMSSYTATINGYARTRRSEIDRVSIIDNRQKVLNNKFQIVGITRYAASETPVEALPGYEDERDMVLVENAVETPLKCSLKDRY
ncbi:MAG: hypothetical protein LBN98_03665 [Prevotellaceae bacterium]|jgi:hypothetical protein|nr:hypothetical protein [Prevotellaceae bacterium]